MKIKTKLIHREAKKVEGIEGYVTIEIDDVLNRFLKENDIQEDRLIDIKFSNVGYFEGTGEIEPVALIIYRT